MTLRLLVIEARDKLDEPLWKGQINEVAVHLPKRGRDESLSCRVDGRVTVTERDASGMITAPADPTTSPAMGMSGPGAAEATA
jgi:hypothetical protein